jgi:hypothetical protein
MTNEDRTLIIKGIYLHEALSNSLSNYKEPSDPYLRARDLRSALVNVITYLNTEHEQTYLDLLKKELEKDHALNSSSTPSKY